MPENQNTLQAAMDRIMGSSPALSPEQTAGGANLYTSALDPSAQAAVRTPVANVSAKLGQEGGAYDPEAKMKEIQAEQLKFSNFAMEETARQRMADLAYQQEQEKIMSTAQAESARMQQDQMNMQNQLLSQQGGLSQPMETYQPPAPQYNYNPVTVAQNAWKPQAGSSGNANPGQGERRANTQQIYR